MSIQLSFSIRVSSAKSVHLIGSWDGYNNQLPLSRDKTSSKSGAWKGTFRFQPGSLEAGERYWYYYIIDGYHCAHNPSVNSTVEPTTGRELNILDMPSEKSSSTSSKSSSSSSSKSSSSSSSKSSSSKHSSSSSKSKSSSSSSSRRSDSRDRRDPSDRSTRRLALDIPKGRPLSSSQIKSPKPVAPGATKKILNDFGEDDERIAQLSARFGAASFDDVDDIITEFDTASPTMSSASSGFSRSSSPTSAGSGYSTPSSYSSSSSSCSCKRYGITRKGDRVKIDCGGSVCGYDSSDCESIYEADNSSRRQGVVIR